MKAVLANGGRPQISELPEPKPTQYEILVDVYATAINRADLMQVIGNYPPPPDAPETLGLELAGEVIGVGEGVANFSVGDRVMALVGGGGYAEKAVVHYEHTMPIPDNLSFQEAAAIPEAFLTAYSNAVEIGRLAEGERFLIHAGASSVGLAAIQIAKVIGATVAVTASAAKHGICTEAGADLCIDYKTEDFQQRILEDYPGVHLIVDMVGAPYWEKNLQILEKWGRLVYIGLQGGSITEANLGVIMRKCLIITGSTLRARTHERKTSLIRNFSEWGLAYFKEGRLKPNIWRVMTFDEVEEAHNLMRRNENAGKIVLTLA